MLSKALKGRALKIVAKFNYIYERAPGERVSSWKINGLNMFLGKSEWRAATENSRQKEKALI
jgi:hypothetical protein